MTYVTEMYVLTQHPRGQSSLDPAQAITPVFWNSQIQLQMFNEVQDGQPESMQADTAWAAVYPQTQVKYKKSHM